MKLSLAVSDIRFKIMFEKLHSLSYSMRKLILFSLTQSYLTLKYLSSFYDINYEDISFFGEFCFLLLILKPRFGAPYAQMKIFLKSIK